MKTFIIVTTVIAAIGAFGGYVLAMNDVVDNLDKETCTAMSSRLRDVIWACEAQVVELEKRVEILERGK